jgi:hypothetical protein
MAASKGGAMARHEVRFNIPERKLGYSDIEFHVYSDDERLGVLKVSQGGVVWRHANKRLGQVMDWDTFDRVMQREGRRERA